MKNERKKQKNNEKQQKKWKKSYLPLLNLEILGKTFFSCTLNFFHLFTSQRTVETNMIPYSLTWVG